ncbi:hypothetical protein D3C84_761610 [compost metagenome]
MSFDHDASSGSNSMANQAAKIRYQARDRRTCVKRATPNRNRKCAVTNRPLANQIPISNRPLMRSKARVEPTVIVANPALQNSSEGSRMLRHSIARYSAAAAARAIESVNIVGGSSAIAGRVCLICGRGL